MGSSLESAQVVEGDTVRDTLDHEEYLGPNVISGGAPLQHDHRPVGLPFTGLDGEQRGIPK